LRLVARLGGGLDSPYTAWLYRGSKLLAHGTNRRLTATISSKPAQGTDAAGFTASVTVINAYAVS
jgi:hypothetical protein